MTKEELGVYREGAERRDTSDGRSDSIFAGGTTNVKYLKLETGTNTLDHALESDYVYVDQLVKFTGFEEPQTEYADGTKIAVWLSAIETEGVEGEADYIAGETNLYVSVGNGTTVTNVCVAGTFTPDTWYRLTIKKIGDVMQSGQAYKQMGFLIWINGEPATIIEADKNFHANSGVMTTTAKAYYDAGKLFTSMTKDALTLNKVSYKGIGGVDDIVLSKSAPDFDLTYDITAPAIANATATLVTQGGKTIAMVEGKYTVRPGDVIITYTAVGPYVITSAKTLTVNVSMDNVLTYDESTIVVEDAAASVTADGETFRYYGYAEVTNAIATDALSEIVHNGDTVTFLMDIEVKPDEDTTLFAVTKNATIEVAAGEDSSDWAVTIKYDGENAGSLEYNSIIKAKKNIEVAFDETVGESPCTFSFGGSTIAGNLTVNGEMTISSSKITIANDASLAAYSYDGLAAGKFTLQGTASVWCQTKLAYTGEDSVFTNELINESGNDTDGYTYTIMAGGFQVIISGTPAGSYPTLADAVEAAPADATIKLLEDVAVDVKAEGVTTLTKNITLDLNGKTLNAGYDKFIQVIENATLTINGTNGTVYGRINVGRQLGSSPNYIADNGNLVINGGTYYVDDAGGQTVVHVNGSCDNSNVTINDAVIESTNDNGVQFNGKGTFTVTNSKITGYTAIYCKAGTLSITNSQIVSTGAHKAPQNDHNGSKATGDAIVLDTTTGYKGDIKLTLDAATTISATDGYAILETVTSGSASATLEINDNRTAKTGAKLGNLNVSDKFLAAVAAGTAKVTGYAAAVNGNVYTTLQAAVDAAGVGQTVTLVADTTENVKVAADKEIAINLGGKTLTGKTSTYTINNLGTLTISNGNMVATISSNTLLRNLGTLTIVDGTYTSNKIVVKNDENGYGVCGTLTINGGTFNPGNDGGEIWDALQNWGNAEINGGLFNGRVNAWACLDWNAGVTTINDGTFKDEVVTTARYRDASKRNVAGVSPAPDHNAEIIINGGTFDGDVVRRIGYDKNEQGETTRWDVTDPNLPATYAGCEYLGKITIVGLVAEELNTAKFKNDESTFCEDGFETKKDGDYYVVSAKTGFAIIIAGTPATTNYFETLDAAIDALNGIDADTVTIMNDLEITSRYEVYAATAGKAVKLDLNGKTITRKADLDSKETYSGNGSAFDIKSGTLTIKNGTIDCSALVQTVEQTKTIVPDSSTPYCECDAITVRSGANLTLTDMTVLVDNITGCCAYPFNGGTLTITSGTYKNTTTEAYPFKDGYKALVVNQFNAAPQSIQLSGGTYYGQDPATGDDSGKVATFLASGYYSVTTAEGVHEVTNTGLAAAIGVKGFMTLAAANAAAKDGDTIKLLADVTVDARIEITKAITIDLDSKKVTRTAALDAKNTYSGNGSVFDLRANAGNVTIKNGTIDCLALTQTVEDTKSIVPGSSTPYCECDAITVRSGANLTLTDMTVLVDNITGCCVYPFNGGTVAITSGTYENRTTEEYTLAGKNIKAMVVNQHNATPQSLVISGGQFKGQNPATGDDSGAVVTFLAKGKATSKVGEYWTIVDAVAEIGDKGYASLDEALAAAVDGDTVTLLANIATAKKEQFKVASNITLDFNGKTITKSLSNDWVIRVNNGVTAIFDDSSTAANGGIDFTPIALGNIDNPASMIQNLGNLTINGGVYASDFTVIKNDEDPGKSSLTVNGGAFTVIPVAAELGYKGKQWALMNWTDATINGGIWTGTIGTRSADRNKVSQAGATEIVALGEGSNANYLLFVGDSKDTTFTNFPKIKVTGAKIDVEKATQCPLDLELVGPDADGWYTVAEKPAGEPVAKIGDKEYTDLHLALTEAKAGETVELIKDVDLTGVANWEPVDFKGAEFDGKGFTISNLKIAKDGNYVGFFSKVDSDSAKVSIHDVTFDNANVTTTTGERHAIVVGCVDHPGFVESKGATFANIFVTNSVISAVKYVGAIVGQTDTSMDFTNIIVVDCEIAASDAQCGALFGYSVGAVTASSIEVRGNQISGKQGAKIGALCGRMNGGVKSYVNVKVDQSSNSLVGSARAGNCEFIGDETEITVAGLINNAEKESAAPGTLVIKAGTWSVDPTEYVPAGFKAEEGSGVWTVRALAEVALTITAENAKVTGITAGTVYEDDELEFTIEPTSGYKVTSVTANGETLTAVEGVYSYTVTGEEAEGALAIVVTTEQAGFTVIIAKGDNVTAVETNGVEVTEIFAQVGQVIPFTLTSDFVVPVFKCGTEVVNGTFYFTAQEATNLVFSAIDGGAQPDVPQSDVKQAIVNSIDLDPQTEKEDYDNAVAKVDLLCGQDAANAKDVAAWIKTQSIDSKDLADTEYAKSSFELDTKLIDDDTEIEVKELVKADGSAVTFKVEVENVEVAKEAIKNMVKATSDVSDWTTAAKQLEITTSFDSATHAITVTPAGTPAAAFMKVVVPKDPK